MSLSLLVGDTPASPSHCPVQGLVLLLHLAAPLFLTPTLQEGDGDHSEASGLLLVPRCTAVSGHFPEDGWPSSP